MFIIGIRKYLFNFRAINRLVFHQHTVHNGLLCPSAILWTRGICLQIVCNNHFLGRYRNKVYRSSLITFGLLFVVWFHKNRYLEENRCLYMLNPLSVELFQLSNFAFRKEQFFVKLLGCPHIFSQFSSGRSILSIGRLSKEKELIKRIWGPALSLKL
jgi:hypothetical protein